MIVIFEIIPDLRQNKNNLLKYYCCIVVLK